MGIELSHRTYDWNRLHTRGDAFVDVLTQAADIPTHDADTMATTLERHITNAWSDGARRYESDTGDIRLGVPGDNEAWRTYSLAFDITPDGRINAHFTVSPDFADDRVLYDGFLDTTPPDGEWLRTMLSYYFETCREAIEVADDTLLSLREAELVLLRAEGHDDETIRDLMGITASNLTQYDTRIAEKREAATEQVKTAEQTLSLLLDADTQSSA